MSARLFTVEEKLAAVEALIEALRWARSQPEVPEHRSRELLKAIARDLRAQLGSAPGKLAHSLERRVEALHRQKEFFGFYPPSSLAGIGEEIVGQWAVVRRALDGMEEGKR